MEREESLYGEVEEVERGEKAILRKLDMLLAGQKKIIALLSPPPPPTAASIVFNFGTPQPTVKLERTQ